MKKSATKATFASAALAVAMSSTAFAATSPAGSHGGDITEVQQCLAV